jgi:hypothetical protein
VGARRRRIGYARYVIWTVFAGCLFLVGYAAAKMFSNGAIEREGEATIAGWSVDVSSSDGDSLTLDAGTSAQSYSLVVTNDSDVVSTYGIKVSNVPDGVKVGLDISSDSDLVTPVDGEVIFTNTGGDLAFTSPNNTRTHTLALLAEPTANVTDFGIDMTIDVLFVQKDPRL